MSNINAVLDWITNEANQKTLTLMGGRLCAFIAGLWTAYQHFSKKPKESSPEISISGTGILTDGKLLQPLPTVALL